MLISFLYPHFIVFWSVLVGALENVAVYVFFNRFIQRPDLNRIEHQQ